MTTIENPARPEVQAAFLKSHLKLMRVGMTNSRITKTQMLEKASAITGVRYTFKSIDKAIADLQQIVDAAMKPTT